MSEKDHEQTSPHEEEQQQQNKKVQKGEALWLMSFSDMSLVLLCFFVLMISTMKPNHEKFGNIKDGMSAKENNKKQESLKSLSKKLSKVIKKKKLDKTAKVNLNANGLQIVFNDGLLFKSGSSKFNVKSKKTINSILKTISKIGTNYRLKIEGHTDDVSSNKRGVNHNWELSAQRGFTLMRQFHKFGVKEESISVIAFAHTKPKVPYKHLKGLELKTARSQNRRVVVWIN